MAKRRESRTAVYVISVAAELAGVHPQTLRVYERKGLLAPERTSGNTRRYSAQDIERLRRIQELTQREGVNLAGAKMVLRLEEQLDRMRRDLEAMASRVRELEADVAREMRHVAHAGEIIPAREYRSLQELWNLQRRKEGKSRRPIEMPGSMGPTAT
jgi:MerR family transcriptional regulator/heat shock protein HspR